MILIRDLCQKDIIDIMPISKEELGNDYLTEEEFETILSSPDSLCKIALLNGNLAGFATCMIFNSNRVDEALKLPDCPDRDMLLKSTKIGLLDAVSVSNSTKGQGIGKKLTMACLDEFVNNDVDTVVAIGWESVTGIMNIKKILEEYVIMIPGIRMKGYWNNFVAPGSHVCPVCGIQCGCFGVLYYKKIK